MKLGEKARITCTPDYAYGNGGFPSWGIMPNATLIFEIEVLAVQYDQTNKNLFQQEF